MNWSKNYGRITSLKKENISTLKGKSKIEGFDITGTGI